MKLNKIRLALVVLAVCIVAAVWLSTTDDNNVAEIVSDGITVKFTQKNAERE